MTKPPHSHRQSTHQDDSTRRGRRVTLFASDTRGQTFFDFVTGISLFLFVVMFTVFFIPGLIDPFEPSPDASTVMADRGADHLTQNVLRADGNGPYVLDRDCTVAFFDGDATASCDVDSDRLHKIVGMTSDSRIHVEVRGQDGNPIVVDGVGLSHGDDVSTAAGDVYVSTRIVTLDDNRYEFKYMVW